MKTIVTVLLFLSVLPLSAFCKEKPVQTPPPASMSPPDSSVVHLVEIFENKKFVVKDTAGKWYEGYVQMKPGGITVLKKRFDRLSNRKKVVLAELEWEQIEEIRLQKLKGGKFNTGIAVGAATTIGFWIFLIIGLSGS